MSELEHRAHGEGPLADAAPSSDAMPGFAPKRSRNKAHDACRKEHGDGDDQDAQRHPLQAKQIGPEQLLGELEDDGADDRSEKRPLTAKERMRIIHTPMVVPAKAVSVGSMKRTILP